MPPEAGTPFAELADLTRRLEATTKRLEKRRLIAEFLRRIPREEVSPAVLIAIGRIFPESDQKALNVGWATLQKALGPARQARLDARPLTILATDPACQEIAGARRNASLQARTAAPADHSAH